MSRSSRQSICSPCDSPATQRRRVGSCDAHSKDELPIELYREARNGAVTRFHEQQQRQRQQQAADQDYDDEDDNVHVAVAPLPNEKPPSLLERIRMEKNRVVQRCLVACRLAEPSRDVFFRQKKQDFADAIEVLHETRRNIQKLTAQVQKFTGAVTMFAGDSSSYAQFGMHRVPRQTFLEAAQQIDEKAYAFSDDVEMQILNKINARIVILDRMHLSIIERGDLQVDVDYAKRKLTVAQQKGDANQIAERKYALLVAQKRCATATKAISQQLEFVTADQQPEIQELLAQFSRRLLDFFQFGDELLARAAPTRAQLPPVIAAQDAAIGSAAGAGDGGEPEPLAVAAAGDGHY